MSINVHWPRWIFASITKHFDANKGALALHVEGAFPDVDLRTDEDFFEVRLDGPYFSLLHKNYWQVNIEVNCLISTVMDRTSYHRIHANAGIVSAAFSECIPIYRYGEDSEPDNDDTLLTNMIITIDRFGRRGDRIEVRHFGQIEKDTPLLQATVEGHYKAHINTGV